MLSLNCHELIGKIKEHKRKKKYLMTDDYMLDGRLEMIISVEKFDTKILIDTK